MSCPPRRFPPSLVACAFLLTTITACAAGAAEAPATQPSAAIQQDLRRFREMGSVLYVAAHPDDENTQLITYLARGRGYRTAYLSLTRGDGGQNVLGGEFGAELGVIRTQELLAARRLDGGQQFFTRALDFGFSKDYRETLNVWDHQQVLADIVRVIRTFRPDVVITRFSPEPGGTHGHHTASAVLAVEAFKLAGDPKAFPEQLTDLKPWQPKRILQNGRGSGTLQIDISGDDPVTGESFLHIAGRSRSMHKSQGFGNYSGGGGDRGARAETFTLLGGEPASKDILDGVDTTWARVPGGAEIGHLADEALERFDAANPAASVPALLELNKRLAALPADPLVDEKRRDLVHIIQSCLGLTVETTVPDAEVVPGEAMTLHHAAAVTADVPVRWVEVRYPSIGARVTEAVELHPGTRVPADSSQTLPAKTPPSQPYWLREEPTAGMFRVDDPKLIGRPENPPVFPVEQVFEVGGQTLVISDEPVEASSTSTTKSALPRRLEVIPPVWLRPVSEVRLFAPRAVRPVEVQVVASRANQAGTLRLDAPSGWTVEPKAVPFRLSSVGDRVTATFSVTAPPQPATAELTAVADVNGQSFDTQRVPIRYPHIPPILLQPKARTKAVALEMQTRGKNVGYLPGAGDSVADCLKEMGYTVTSLSGADLTSEKLRGLDAVVVGVRALNVRTDLADAMPALLTYVEGGGNMIVQYDRPDGLKTTKLAPYDLKLSGLRVTDEHAPVTLLAADHPALNVPNKIGNADFDGWVQERGVYFPSDWDEHFTPLLAMNDPGEKPLKGSLLVAKHGRGYFVYTGLTFFRQLPAAVPGAYRLFANLVSLGK